MPNKVTDSSLGLFLDPDNATGGWDFVDESSGSGYQDAAIEDDQITENYKYGLSINRHKELRSVPVD